MSRLTYVKNEIKIEKIKKRDNKATFCREAVKKVKFRFWSNEQHFMLYEDDNTLTNLGHLIDSGNNITWGEWCKENYYGILNDWADWTPMQYTNLKDKNNKEVYEGDIVQWSGAHKQRCLGWIEWDDYRCGFGIAFMGEKGQKGIVSLYHCNDREIVDEEVIGNIYENPELIKEE